MGDWKTFLKDISENDNSKMMNKGEKKSALGSTVEKKENKPKKERIQNDNALL